MRTEFQELFGNVNSAAFSEVATNWFQLPPYFKLSDDLRQKAESLVVLQGSVGTFTEKHRQAVSKLVEEKDHFEALRLADQRFLDAEKIFLGDDLVTARIFTLRRRGWVKEHLATFGEMSKYPLGDSMRTLCFVGGAMDYMQGDVELGCATDYGMRIAECLGGAQIPELQVAAIVKLFGENITIVGVNGVDGICVKDLARRAFKTINIGQVPAGHTAKIIAVNMPDTESN